MPCLYRAFLEKFQVWTSGQSVCFVMPSYSVRRVPTSVRLFLYEESSFN